MAKVGGHHAQKQERRKEKIASFFDRLESTEEKRGNPEKMRSFIQKRQQLDRAKRELKDAGRVRPKDGVLIKRLQGEVKRLKAEVQADYMEGPQGLSPAQMKEKRSGQWKAASIEGLHTVLGARLLSATSGVVSPVIAGVGSKVALHQGLGYGPQSVLSGLFRIVTEVPQVRMNPGGKPALPPNLAATSTFNQNRREMEAARADLQAVTQSLRQAYEAAARDASSSHLDTLQRELRSLAQALGKLARFDTMYENLCIQLEREFRGKRASAVVSALAGMMSAAGLVIDPTGAAALAGKTILSLGGVLLQGPVAPIDYMDSNVDYPQKISAKKIDLSLLVKPESRHKDLDALEDQDLDTTIALKLYDEQPKLMQSVLRSIYTHKMGELNSKRLKLERELQPESKGEGEPRAQQAGGPPSASQCEKREALAKVRQDFDELKNQIVAFEQHGRDAVDPDGLIGKAIADPLFFCKRGVHAAVFNKVGEFWSQANQRFSNYLNPMLSIGLVSVALDGVSLGMGADFIRDGVRSGDPADTSAAAGLLTAAGIGAINSGATVGPARFNKMKFDRAKLAAPPYIAKGKGIDGVEAREQLGEALKNRIVSAKKRAKLEKALSIIEASEAPVAQRPAEDRLAKARRRWEKFETLKQHVNEMVQDVNEHWLIEVKGGDGEPLRGHDGKPIVVDLRSTAACHRQYVPALERVLVPLREIPRSIRRSMTFWRDVIRAKWERDRCRGIVDDGRFVDEELGRLVRGSERLVQARAAVEVDPVLQAPEQSPRREAGTKPSSRVGLEVPAREDPSDSEEKFFDALQEFPEDSYLEEFDLGTEGGDMRQAEGVRAIPEGESKERRDASWPQGRPADVRSITHEAAGGLPARDMASKETSSPGGEGVAAGHADRDLESVLGAARAAAAAAAARAGAAAQAAAADAAARAAAAAQAQGAAVLSKSARR